MKIVANRCFGGFDLSTEVLQELDISNAYDCKRDNPLLVTIVEELGIDACTSHSAPKTIEIPDEATDWDIFECDGFETVVYVLDGKIHRK